MKKISVEIAVVLLVLTRVYCQLTALLREPSHNQPDQPLGKVLTKAELSEYDGTDPERPILLAILGRVFDVTAGARHYGYGAPYAHFSGRDATRAFYTGDFVGPGLTDDINGLDDKSLQGLIDWLQFFENHEQYSYHGLVEGRFFDSSGRALIDFPWERLEKRKQHVEFPECNYRWGAKLGGFDDTGEVWCSMRSGGIERSWAGLPRRLIGTEERSGVKCVCVPMSRAIAHAPNEFPIFDLYPGCKWDSERCRITSL